MNVDPDEVRRALPEALLRRLRELQARGPLTPAQTKMWLELERRGDPDFWQRLDAAMRRTPAVRHSTGLVDIEPQLRAVADDLGLDPDEAVAEARLVLGREGG